VITTLRFVVDPEQIVFVPLNVALLAGVFTVIVAPPLPATKHPLASVTLPVMLYVVVAAGLTGIAVPLAYPASNPMPLLIVKL
jgi:hypothetical protein